MYRQSPYVVLAYDDLAGVDADADRKLYRR
jgi:hypothetical protein